MKIKIYSIITILCMLLPLFSCNKDEPDEETDVVFPTEPDYKDLDNDEYLTYLPIIVKLSGYDGVKMYNIISINENGNLSGDLVRYTVYSFWNKPAEFFIYRTDGEPLVIANYVDEFTMSPVLSYGRYFVDPKNNCKHINDNRLDPNKVPKKKHVVMPKVGEKIITEDYELELINPSKLRVKLYPTNYTSTTYHTMHMSMLIEDLPIERMVDNKGRNVAITDEIDKEAIHDSHVVVSISKRPPTRSLQEIVMPFAVKTEIHKK